MALALALALALTLALAPPALTRLAVAPALTTSMLKSLKLTRLALTLPVALP